MKLAIVGMGPRGLSALEQLITKLSQKRVDKKVEILLFEASHLEGYGHVYNIDQPDTNWLNITERGLEGLPGRPTMTYRNISIPGISAYQNSEYRQSPEETDDSYPDVFPLRSTVGKYLKQRYDTLISALKKLDIVQIIKEEVIEIFQDEEVIQLKTKQNNIYYCDEILLTIGHQPTELSDQIKSWNAHADRQEKIINIAEAYPIKNILNTIQTSEHRIIALRGFGLASIDVIRALIHLYGGKFEMQKNNMDVKKYNPTHSPLSIIPFSLDGLPCVPKPYSPALDQRYTPSAEKILLLAKDLKRNIETKERNHLFFINTMAKLITSIFVNDVTDGDKKYTETETSEIETALVNWIYDGSYSDKYMTSQDLNTIETIKLHIEIAKGISKPNLDYFAGQVWRHCQPTLYNVLSHSHLSDIVMSEIIAIDERIKRYSYGPPVASMEQIVGLFDAGVIDFTYINNPEIQLHKEGWKLMSEDLDINASAMINTVIDSPEILQIESPIIKNLLADDQIQAIHQKLGIDTFPNGQICVPNDHNNVPIYILGRIVKGSVIGVDAILECFGSRISDWAEDCVSRVVSIT